MIEKSREKVYAAVLCLLLITIFFAKPFSLKGKEEAIIDSDMTFEQAIEGTKAPQELIEQLVLLDVYYYSFDEKMHKGQFVVHQDVVEDVKAVFDIILDKKFLVAKVVPIVKYDWSDDASMQDNNSSAFNYRFIAGTERLSNHAFGKAVDINPMQNPVIYESGSISPKGAKYNVKKDGTFHKDCSVVVKFKELGWRWGGDFTSFKDYHHFDKK